MRGRKRRIAIAIALAGSAGAAADPPAVPEAVPGWTALVDGLRDLPGQILAKLPEPERSDRQVRAEVGRLALEAFTSSALDTLGSDGDHPAFVAQINQVLNVGQPNADTGYRSARITPGGSYRLRGRRGSLRMMRLAQVAAVPGGGARPTLDMNALHVDADGRFDLLLSPARPPGYTGDWWRLAPDTNRLLLRLVNADWGHETEPTLAIERLDAPANRPRVPAAVLERRLRALPAAARFIGTLFADHVARLRQEGYVNRLKVFDTGAIGGLPGQFYYEAAYDLRNDEALIVEARVPAHCLYRSMILTNPLYETTDWYNDHSSLNDAQAKPDADGVVRIVVSARDPGVANWLDTAGYPQGAIQGRWAECDVQPVPTTRKVALGAVRAALPRTTAIVTSAQRDAIVRARRAALQQRPLW